MQIQVELVLDQQKFLHHSGGGWVGVSHGFPFSASTRCITLWIATIDDPFHDRIMTAPVQE